MLELRKHCVQVDLNQREHNRKCIIYNIPQFETITHIVYMCVYVHTRVSMSTCINCAIINIMGGVVWYMHSTCKRMCIRV